MNDTPDQLRSVSILLEEIRQHLDSPFVLVVTMDVVRESGQGSTVTLGVRSVHASARGGITVDVQGLRDALEAAGDGLGDADNTVFAGRSARVN